MSTKTIQVSLEEFIRLKEFMIDRKLADMVSDPKISNEQYCKFRNEGFDELKKLKKMLEPQLIEISINLEEESKRRE